MADVPILGRSKSSFRKLIQLMPKGQQREWESLLHSLLFKYEQDFFRNTDSGENSYSGANGYFWGVDEANGASVLIENAAANITLDTSNFDGLLSSADDTPQKAADTLDNHTIDDHPLTYVAQTVVSGGTLGVSSGLVRASGTFTLYLPAAASAIGIPITVHNIGSGTITIDGDGSETINGSTTYAIDSQYESATFLSDGITWSTMCDFGKTDYPKITIGGSSNYINVTADGHLTLVGNATVWDDLRVPVTSTVLGGANDPTFGQVQDNGAGSTGVFSYKFSKTTEQEVFFSVQIPHAWKEGTTIWPHVHWMPDDTESGSPTVIWGLEYSWSNIGAKFPNTTLITGTETGPFSDVQHYVTAIGSGISGTGKTAGSIILGRLYRDATSDTYDDNAIMLSFDFHIEIEKMGSDTNPSNP